MQIADLSRLRLNVVDPIKMTIRSPGTGEPLVDAEGNPAWIAVLHRDSEPGRSAMHDRENERLRWARRRTGPTSEGNEYDVVYLLVALTTDWHLLTLWGEPIDLPFSPEAAKAVYSEPGMLWLRTQVDAFIANDGNFMPARA